MKRSLITFAIRVLLAVAAGACVLPFAMAQGTPICSPDESETSDQRADAPTLASFEIQKRLQAIQYTLRESGDSKALRNEMTTLKQQLQDYINKYGASVSVNHASNTLPLIRDYFDLAKQLIKNDLQRQPGQLSSLSAYRNVFELQFKPEQALEIFPNRASIPDELEFYPVAGHQELQQLSFKEAEIIRYYIRGIGFSRRDVGVNYLETSRCLLAATEVSKMALNQILRGQFSIDTTTSGPGNEKVCGNITLKQMTEAYLRYHGQPHFATHRRTALAKALPTIPQFLSSGVESLWKEKKLLENGQYIAITLGEAKHSEFGADEIRAEVEGAIERLERSFYQIRQLPLLTAQSEVQSSLFKVIQGCNLAVKIKSTNEFFAKAMAAERLHFYNELLTSIENISANIVDMPEAMLDRTIYRMLFTARLRAAVIAILSGLSDAELPQSLSDLENTLDAWVEKTLIPVARNQILLRDHSSLVNEIKARYRNQLRLTPPFTQLREEYRTQLKNFSRILVKYDNPATTDAELPFRASHILEIYKDKVSALSPKAQELAQIIFGEKDHQIAHSLWLKTNTFFRENLAELKIGGKVFTQDRLIDKPKTWITSLFTSQDEKAVLNVGKLNGNDFYNLKFIAERLGLVDHEKAPETLADVMLEITADKGDGKRMNPAQYADTVNIYRNLLKSEIFGQWRILEMPFGSTGERFYQILNRQPMSADITGLVNAAVTQVQKNVASHLKKIVAAKTVDDIKPYIIRTQILNVLLGEIDLPTYILQKDYWPSVVTVGEMNSDEEYVFPHLLQYHLQLKSRLLRTEDRGREQWDEFFSAMGFAATPLMIAWGVKAILPWLPRAFGGAYAASRMQLLANNMHYAIEGYWAAFFGYIGADVVVQLNRRDVARNQLASVEELAYTESYRNIETPLISQHALERQRKLFNDRYDDATSRAAFNIVFFVLPFATYKAATYYIEHIKPKRFGKKQEYVDRLKAEGRFAEALNIENGYAATYTRQFARKAKLLDVEFQQLGVAPGTWRPSELMSALQRIREANDPVRMVRAELAFARIIAELGKRYVSLESTPVMRDAFIKAIFGSEHEANVFVSVYRDLGSRGRL